MNRQRINEQAREYRNNAVKSGYVYIMSHDDYPGVLKVGESYDVLRRMSVMSSATVGNFHIEWVAMSSAPAKDEASLHLAMSSHHLMLQ